MGCGAAAVLGLAAGAFAHASRWPGSQIFGRTLIAPRRPGELALTFNRLDLAADPGLTLFTYTAEPGSRSEEALRLLGSWAATADAAESAHAPDQS